MTVLTYTGLWLQRNLHLFCFELCHLLHTYNANITRVWTAVWGLLPGCTPYRIDGERVLIHGKLWVHSDLHRKLCYDAL